MGCRKGSRAATGGMLCHHGEAHSQSACGARTSTGDGREGEPHGRDWARRGISGGRGKSRPRRVAGKGGKDLGGGGPVG